MPHPQHTNGPRPVPSWALGVLVAAGIALVYGFVWHAGYIWDDDAHLTAHKCIIGPKGFAEIWTTAEANYFPLVLTQWWLLHQISGLNPVAYHLDTLLLHAGNVLLLWAVLRRLRIPGALFAAVLWGVHPVLVESVAWVSETTNTQSTLFFLAAAWFWCRWIDTEPASRASRAAYGLTIACVLAAVTSKPAAVMLPVALALGAWWLGRFGRRQLVALLPLLAISTLVSGWTIWEQRVHSGATGTEWQVGLVGRGLIAGRAIWFYLGRLAWPYPLNFIYPRWNIDVHAGWSYVPVIGAVAVGIALYAGRRGSLRPVAFAGAFFASMLFPVLGFFDVYYFRYSYVADHFQYLASIGITVLVGSALTLLGRRVRPPLRLAGGAALVGSLALLTLAQTRMYENSDRLYTTILARDRECWMAHNNYGMILADQRQAMAHYEAALAVNPNHIEARTNLGVALARLGRRSEAMAEFERVLALDPGYPPAHLNLGALIREDGAHGAEAMDHFRKALLREPELAEAHNALGTELAKLPGGENEALSEYETAVRLDPKSTGAWRNLARLYRKMGRKTEALSAYERLLQWAPNNADAHLELAMELEQDSARAGEAVAHYEAAIRLKPTDAVARQNLGTLYASMPGHAKEAIRLYEAAMALDPTLATVHYNLGAEWAKIPGRNADAVAQYEAALKLDPTLAEAHGNLANQLVFQRGRLAEALEHYRAAVRLKPDDAGAHVNLGNALLQHTYRIEEAIAQYEAAVRLSPADAMAHNNLAAAYAAAKRRDDAIRELERALALKPDLSQARQNLAQLRRLMMKTGEKQ